MGGIYTQRENHLLPNLVLPAEGACSIGVCGQWRLRYLKQHHKVLYYNLLTSGKLQAHLADTESLWAEDMMVWMRRMVDYV